MQSGRVFSSGSKQSEQLSLQFFKPWQHKKNFESIDESFSFLRDSLTLNKLSNRLWTLSSIVWSKGEKQNTQGFILLTVDQWNTNKQYHSSSNHRHLVIIFGGISPSHLEYKSSELKSNFIYNVSKKKIKKN